MWGQAFQLIWAVAAFAALPVFAMAMYIGKLQRRHWVQDPVNRDLFFASGVLGMGLLVVCLIFKVLDSPHFGDRISSGYFFVGVPVPLVLVVGAYSFIVIVALTKAATRTLARRFWSA